MWVGDWVGGWVSYFPFFLSPAPLSVEEVAACRNALQCLLEGQDYPGALEMLGNLRHLVKRQEGLGLRAFRETGPQVGMDGEGVAEDREREIC